MARHPLWTPAAAATVYADKPEHARLVGIAAAMGCEGCLLQTQQDARMSLAKAAAVARCANGAENKGGLSAAGLD